VWAWSWGGEVDAGEPDFWVAILLEGEPAYHVEKDGGVRPATERGDPVLGVAERSGESQRMAVRRG
jgi:hypothetical protein